jgi:hypothetical protein
VTDSAAIGLIGVIIGSVTSLLASVVVPWVRDTTDRRRVTREQIVTERREWLMATLSALLHFRQVAGNPADRGPAQARVGTALNELTVRITTEEQPVIDVLMAMLAMVQQPRPGIDTMVGEAMTVLTLWARGDVTTAAVIGEVERRAGVTFSDDHKTVAVTKQP